MSTYEVFSSTALVYYGKDRPDFNGLVEDIENPRKILVGRLKKRLRRLYEANKPWLQDQRLKHLEDGQRKRLVKLEQQLNGQSKSKIAQWVKFVRLIYDNKPGEIGFQSFDVDYETSPNPRQAIQDTIYRLPSKYRPKKGILEGLNEDKFLVAISLICGQLCGLTSMLFKRASELNDFVLIYQDIEKAVIHAEWENKWVNKAMKLPIAKGRGRRRLYSHKHRKYPKVLRVEVVDIGRPVADEL